VRITQTHDQLAAIGEKVDKAKPVYVPLNGFTKSWEPFVNKIYTHENLLFGRDFVMIASRKRLGRSLNPTGREIDREENLALVSQA
jgi:hypothetical protein